MYGYENMNGTNPLTHDQILELRDAAISAGFAQSRRVLLAGIDRAFIVGLREVDAPGEQILIDLVALRDAGALTDGSVPLALWLQNAAVLARSRKEAIIFQRALDLIITKSAYPSVAGLNPWWPLSFLVPKTSFDVRRDNQKSEPGRARRIPLGGWIAGATLLAFVVISARPVLDPTCSLLLRTAVCIGGAAFGATLPRLLSTSWTKTRLLTARAMSALAVFTLILFAISKASSDADEKRWRSVNQSARNHNRIVVADQSEMAAIIASSDIEELVDTYEYRAEVVRSKLSQFVTYEPVADYLKSFETLHAQHVSAIRKGHLVHAAQILREMHSLSRDLDKSNFWARSELENPGMMYSLCEDAFSRGDLIVLYSGTRLSDVLALERGTVPTCGKFSITRKDVDWARVPGLFYAEFKPPKQ